MMEQQLPIHLLPPQAEGETARACTYRGREVSVISSGSLLPSVLSRTQGWLGGEREREARHLLLDRYAKSPDIKQPPGTFYIHRPCTSRSLSVNSIPGYELIYYRVTVGISGGGSARPSSYVYWKSKHCPPIHPACATDEEQGRSNKETHKRSMTMLRASARWWAGLLRDKTRKPTWQNETYTTLHYQATKLRFR